MNLFLRKSKQATNSHLKAIFTGKDGSMGFVNGKTYNVKTYINSSQLLWVKCVDTGKRCGYSRLETLLPNWKFIDGENNEKQDEWDSF